MRPQFVAPLDLNLARARRPDTTGLNRQVQPEHLFCQVPANSAAVPMRCPHDPRYWLYVNPPPCGANSKDFDPNLVSLESNSGLKILIRGIAFTSRAHNLNPRPISDNFWLQFMFVAWTIHLADIELTWGVGDIGFTCGCVYKLSPWVPSAPGGKPFRKSGP